MCYRKNPANIEKGNGACGICWPHVQNQSQNLPYDTSIFVLQFAPWPLVVVAFLPFQFLPCNATHSYPNRFLRCPRHSVHQFGHWRRSTGHRRTWDSTYCFNPRDVYASHLASLPVWAATTTLLQSPNPLRYSLFHTLFRIRPLIVFFTSSCFHFGSQLAFDPAEELYGLGVDLKPRFSIIFSYSTTGL